MSSSDFERFGAAEHGVRWALSNLPDVTIDSKGVRASALDVLPAPLPGAEGPDDWSLKFSKGSVAVLSNSAVGTICAILELSSMLRGDRHANVARRLKFRTRNYKHEMRIRPDDPRSVLRYTDAMWESLVRQIVGRQFNGLVIYPSSQHPFEHILDYKEYSDVVGTTDADRTAIREALCRMLSTAHRYGLTTFMQHYVGHFPKELGEQLDFQETPNGLLSTVEHPQVYRYSAYCYREIFRQLPDLDGLYFNFESSRDFKLVLTAAIPEFAKMEKKPVCVYRLWGASSVEGVRSIVNAAKAAGSRVILGHKIADTSDTYHHPKADSRVMEWHKRLPGQEFMFLIGPCHNCLLHSGLGAEHTSWPPGVRLDSTIPTVKNQPSSDAAADEPEKAEDAAGRIPVTILYNSLTSD